MGEDSARAAAEEGELGGDGGAGGAVLTMWTIYWSPLDVPGLFVVRGFDIVPGIAEPVPRKQREVRPSLETARECVPAGLYRLERSPGDHDSVVETWL